MNELEGTSNETYRSLTRFLEGYKKFNSELAVKKISVKKKSFEQLLTGFISVNDRSQKAEEHNTTTYNIFKIMKNVFKDEERVHSPIVADLLNISGTHRQGGLFYNEFLNILKIENRHLFYPGIKSLQRVELEKKTNEGNIDILISYFDGIRKYAIAIENKIYGDDQPDQLERYFKYLRSEYENYFLVYLAPFGRDPSIPFSISRKSYLENAKAGRLFLMNYNIDISDLIVRTIDHVKAPKVKLMLTQYLEIVKSL